MEKRDQHGRDDGGGAHAGKAGAQPGPHAGEKADHNNVKQIHGSLLSASARAASTFSATRFSSVISVSRSRSVKPASRACP